MKPLFTIHEGEYLVGSHIEKNYPNWHVWIPSKDKGIDFLVSNSDDSKTASIQVKFSKDYVIENKNPIFKKQIVCGGWWTLNKKKLYESQADFWVMVMHSYSKKNIQYIIIPSEELYRRQVKLHPKPKMIQTYLTVTEQKKCWETRGWNKQQFTRTLSNEIEEIDEARNFTEFLNNWGPLEGKLGL